MVGEPAHPLEAEHPREALERVRGAEQAVGELGIEVSARALVGEIGEIGATAANPSLF